MDGIKLSKFIAAKIQIFIEPGTKDTLRNGRRNTFPNTVCFYHFLPLYLSAVKHRVGTDDGTDGRGLPADKA